MRESTWQGALKRANLEVEEAVARQEEALNELEEAKAKAAMATREAADLRAYAREQQLAFDRDVYQHRYTLASRFGRAGASASTFQAATMAPAGVGGGSRLNVQELEEVEQGLRNRLESFKARAWSGHGVGAEGESEIASMRAIKAIFDPDGIMNPGKIFSADESELQ